MEYTSQGDLVATMPCGQPPTEQLQQVQERLKTNSEFDTL